MIKKIRQNTTWIEADFLGINLTPNRYNALAPAIVYVSDDVTIPFNSVTSREQHKERYYERKWMRLKSFWNLRISIYLCTRANKWRFDSVYIKGTQMKSFQ